MNKESLILELEKLNLDTSKVDLLEAHMLETLKANESFNLTAIKEAEKFRELMILDSAYAFKYFDFSDKKIIDIGTGAGYPGMVLATLSKGEFTLLDSTSKKVEFLRNFSSKNGYFNVNCVCDRAENFAKNHREEYDFAIARAVSELPILLELVLPHLKVGGYFIALKGSKGQIELEESKTALEKLGGEVYKIDEYELPESKEKRINIIIKKVKETNKKYPREYNQIISKKL
jgi:16S rRNA (guanine527-N7)-methyltransferase